MGLWDRLFRRRDEPAREGARRGAEEALLAPPLPPAAEGEPPPSPAAVLRDAGADVRDLVWIGTPRGGEPVWVLGAPADTLVPWWQQLRLLHARSGWWPILIGPDVTAFVDRWHADEDADAGAQVRRGRELDPAGVLAQMVTEVGEPELGRRLAVQPAPSVVVQAAATPGYVALMRVEQPYDVPAAVSWLGAANYDVEPAQHAAVLRGWAKRYRAEIVALTADTIELVVSRPPRDPDEALAVAREQYAYCPDIVEQGSGRLWDLAGTQVVSPSWFFWWD